MVYLNVMNQCAFLLIRTFHMGSPWFSLRGAHELCIQREGSSLQLRRWSQTAQASKPWAWLYFKTWEGPCSIREEEEEEEEELQSLLFLCPRRG